jgi:hypothetical protein
MGFFKKIIKEAGSALENGVKESFNVVLGGNGNREDLNGSTKRKEADRLNAETTRKNNEILRRNAIIEKRNLYSERVKTTFQNNTSFQTGANVTGNFNSANVRMQNQDRQQNLFNNANQNRLQPDGEKRNLFTN